MAFLDHFGDWAGKTANDAGKVLYHAGQNFGAGVSDTINNSRGGFETVLKEVGKAINQAGGGIKAFTEQAKDVVKAETDKINMDGANGGIHEAAKVMEEAIDGMDSDGFEGWIKKATEQLGVQTALEDLQYVKLEEVPAAARDYIKEHPDQVILFVAGSVVFLAPWVVYGPVLSGLGFGAKGVGAGSLAANMQRTFRGAVPAGGWFARLTSAGAGGYGVGVLNGVIRAGVVAGGLVKAAVDQKHEAQKGKEGK
ncbi:hypothetical protein LTR56_013875 [Elasticomyces elasticus]|nr:hypothetical protein LTR22_026035 [Elasticomyces elasticus]KAK3636979.1 hypothetical protein LTR56_013875 [Elasticomyces elasticus]KAK4924545.1 hypothetical protein LTR49_008435 [Elasticomyces elasticus]KAK5761744.1 hypothetical protein LTS12_008177 [Elasticomyces elasticus]